mmetsp:Transcript_13106/g.30873  ORF Transcript_13106/g.30873 Transcript_13106/m.30873 type:complete len:150 (-) Transcript_13106:260-709(-)
MHEMLCKAWLCLMRMKRLKWINCKKWRVWAMTTAAQRKKNNEFDYDVENSENDKKEPVVLRDSFLTVMSQQQLDQDQRSVNESSSDALSISDCWSYSNIDANIDNMYSGNTHDSPLSSPAKHFFHNVGRNVVLPFLDHVVGDQKNDDDK